jgi:CheY-like chemotaxis protein
LIVSENPTGPLYDSDLLRQPELGLLTAFPDSEALEIVRRERPSLIVEDLEPPGHAGLAFCRGLASDASTRSIPLILVAHDSLRGEASKTHAGVVLSKPLQARAFFDAVRRFVPLPHRRTRRVSINFRFTYRVGDRVAQAFSRDLSARGAFLKTDRLLPLGTRLELSFCIPGFSEGVQCGAVVRGTSSTRHAGEPGGIAIEFEGLSEADRKLLETFMDQHPQRSLLAR